MSESIDIDLTVKVAAVQMDPQLNNTAANLAHSLDCIDEAASAGAGLIVFPECSISAYVYPNNEEASAAAESVPGPATEQLSEKAKEHGVHIVAGLIEADGDRLYNTAVLVGPDGLVGKYRKMHPWYPVEKKWPITPGDISQGFPVFDTPVGKIGLCVCYDMSIPETSRILALNGAEIIAFPTNTVAAPQGHFVFDHQVRTRAMDSHVWIVGANRIGVESKVPFAGRSQIVDPYGEVLVEASRDQSEIIYADIDPTVASRDKMFVPKLPSSDLWRSRRPESYGKISAKKD